MNATETTRDHLTKTIQSALDAYLEEISFEDLDTADLADCITSAIEKGSN